jgi:hypothetical protein
VTGFGGDSDRATPVPIPNTEVKPVSADGTWVDSPWESRTPPDFSSKWLDFGRATCRFRARALLGWRAMFGAVALDAAACEVPRHDRSGQHHVLSEPEGR